MRKKIGSILLIDDDEPTNFIHEMILKKMDCSDKIMTVQSGVQALAFLASCDGNDLPYPDVILLDINMPGMNGWEFLEEFKDLEEVNKKVKLAMLTSSFNPDDENRARSISVVDDFLKKPLMPEMISGFFEKHLQIAI